MEVNNNFLEYFGSVDDVIGNLIREIKKIGSKVVLFGSGYCASMVIDLCQISDIKIDAIIDNNKEKWGMTLRGIRITSFEEMLSQNNIYPILISTSHFDEIISQIMISNYKGMIFNLPLDAYYKNSVYSLDYVKENSNRFSDAYNALADDCSKKVFLNVIKHNISLDNRYFEEIKDYEISGYFGTDLYKNREDEVIVDAGAFTGDTIQEFFSHEQHLCKKIYAFEPDIVNYNFLKENIRAKSMVIPVCAGLGEKCNRLKFIMGGGVSSKIDEEGGEMVEIETLDHFFINDIPTFIKMDIEGAEKAALIGGKTIISKYHPTLAVSAYHRAEDLFSLVELIQNLGRGEYNIYLRHTFYYQKVKVQPDVIIYAVKGEENNEFGKIQN